MLAFSLITLTIGQRIHTRRKMQVAEMRREGRKCPRYYDDGRGGHWHLDGDGE
jgi:hypothetical protein